MIAHLGLGSNLGDRLGHLGAAVSALKDLDPGLAVSPVYETMPVGGPEQGTYLNCVVAFDTDLSPADLLALAGELESRAGRVRTVANGPRTLDVDILLLGDLQLSTPELTVPHPRMAERAFVLAPLEDLDPGLVPKGWRDGPPGADLVNGVRNMGKLLGS